MKKLTTIIVALALAIPATAQKNYIPAEKWNVRAGASEISVVQLFGSLFDAFVQVFNTPDDQMSELVLPPTFSVEGMYSLSKRWSVGLDLSYSASYAKLYKKVGKDGKGEFIQRRNYMTLIFVSPEIRYNYICRPLWRMYGSAAAGIAIATEAEGPGVGFSFQVNPLGFEVGKKLYGFLEGGIGLEYYGGRLGIGYRF